MGYNIEIFTEPESISEELLCAVCHDVLEEPVLVQPCEHTFCKACIERWRENSNTCPVDREPAEELKKPPRIYLSLLGALQVCCLFKNAGCNAVLKLEYLFAHARGCEFNPENTRECSGGCGLILKLSDVEAHNCVAYLLDKLRIQSAQMRATEAELSLKNSELKAKADLLKAMEVGLDARDDQMRQMEAALEKYRRFHPPLAQLLTNSTSTCIQAATDSASANTEELPSTTTAAAVRSDILEFPTPTSRSNSHLNPAHLRISGIGSAVFNNPIPWNEIPIPNPAGAGATAFCGDQETGTSPSPATTALGDLGMGHLGQTLTQLLGMGFPNHNGELRRLVISKEGNLEQVLDALHSLEGVESVQEQGAAEAKAWTSAPTTEHLISCLGGRVTDEELQQQIMAIVVPLLRGGIPENDTLREQLTERLKSALTGVGGNRWIVGLCMCDPELFYPLPNGIRLHCGSWQLDLIKFYSSFTAIYVELRLLSEPEVAWTILKENSAYLSSFNDKHDARAHEEIRTRFANHLATALRSRFESRELENAPNCKLFMEKYTN